MLSLFPQQHSGWAYSRHSRSCLLILSFPVSEGKAVARGQLEQGMCRDRVHSAHNILVSGVLNLPSPSLGLGDVCAWAGTVVSQPLHPYFRALPSTIPMHCIVTRNSPGFHMDPLNLTPKQSSQSKEMRRALWPVLHQASLGRFLGPDLEFQAHSGGLLGVGRE